MRLYAFEGFLLLIFDQILNVLQFILSLTISFDIIHNIAWAIYHVNFLVLNITCYRFWHG